jgi:TonB dependent receptor/TonB-dependent Receptor Plug Domain
MSLLLLTSVLACPQDPARLPPIVVEGRADDLVGTADAASEGTTGREELRRRPLLRPAEVIETVPGVVVTQHSGSGKSNQLFARGFNLDHGTDLAISLFGVPMNLPSHGHGQGYTDLNPLIPELVDTVRWRLGPYDVRDGDFGSAGAIDIDYVRKLDRGFVKIEGGSYDHVRSVYADSHQVGGGTLLTALELQQTDGRFTVDQDYSKQNGFLSWSTDTLRLTGFAHRADWTSTDQIPRRAVRSGQLGRFDSLDPTCGGTTEWTGAAAEWTPTVTDGKARLLGYGFHYALDLWSNFTYALDDPIGGDQFAQRDGRSTFGLEGSRSWHLATGGMPTEFTLGAELRSDRIHNGLHGSEARQRRSTVRSDAIDQRSLAAYGELRFEPTAWLRGQLGLRGDQYWFDVDSDLDANSGTADDGILSTKAGLAVGPWQSTELYLNYGTGFHSNDARGVLLRDAPATPVPDDGQAVDALVRSRGAEVGVRTTVLPGLQSTLALWTLELDSELVFVGDAGTTEPNRGSRRHGIEFANHYRPLPWLAFDADVTTATARFRGDDPAGNYIPGTVPLTVVGGVGIDWSDSFSTGLRLRYLGNRPLIEDGSVRSSSTTLVNARATLRLDAQREFALDVLNLFDREDSDIEYFYGSQLPGEAAPVDDVHFHPVAPFTVRLSFTARF